MVSVCTCTRLAVVYFLALCVSVMLMGDVAAGSCWGLVGGVVKISRGEKPSPEEQSHLCLALCDSVEEEELRKGIRILDGMDLSARRRNNSFSVSVCVCMHNFSYVCA